MAALRLGLLVPYALFAAWWAPRLAGTPPAPPVGLAGAEPPGGPTLLLALAVAALVTIPWPVTGALGDGLTSLSLALHALAWAVPQVLLLWGVVFCLLTSTFPRPWVAALVTILISALAGLARAAGARWGALQDALLPAAAGVPAHRTARPRRGHLFPALLVAFCVRAAPLLFVDPRDVLAQDIPEPQHILSHTIVLATHGGAGAAPVGRAAHLGYVAGAGAGGRPGCPLAGAPGGGRRRAVGRLGWGVRLRG